MVKRYSSVDQAIQVRTNACRFAAAVMASRPSIELTPTIFSLAVFFEAYIAKGSAATAKDFGPKKPAKLRMVGNPPPDAA